jgi:hypothetical protein
MLEEAEISLLNKNFGFVKKYKGEIADMEGKGF